MDTDTEPRWTGQPDWMLHCIDGSGSMMDTWMNAMVDMASETVTDTTGQQPHQALRNLVSSEVVLHPTGVDVKV